LRRQVVKSEQYYVEKPHYKSAACNISPKREPPKRPMQSSEGSIAKLLKARLFAVASIRLVECSRSLNHRNSRFQKFLQFCQMLFVNIAGITRVLVAQ